MTDKLTLYGAPGYGSVIVEAALVLLDEAFEAIDVPADDPQGFLESLKAVNPMGQTPALVLPSGELMTESAAILVWLADRAGRLAPAIDDPARAQFLRWMTFIPASIYSMYWLRDDPSRLAATKEAEAVLMERSAERIAECWRIMDAQVRPGRYILGDEMTVLDLYVAIVSRWTPRRKRFCEVAPKMAEVVRRVDADPRLADFWPRRYPFDDGWEG